MNNNNIFLRIIAGINRIKSKLQLQKDLDEITGLEVQVTPAITSGARQGIQRDLDALQNLSVNVEGELDRARTQANLDRELESMTGSVQVTADLDPNSAAALRSQSAGYQTGMAFYVDDDTDSIINRYQVLTRLWDSAENAARHLIDTTTELDAKLTDLRMVTGSSYEDTYKLVGSYNDLAKQLGSTTGEALDAASEWLRQGKTASETSELIEQSMILSKVGAMDSATTAKRLTSALNGYQLAAGQAGAVVDKLTSLDLKAAVSSDELAEALSHTASSANLAGVSLDKILSYITVVEETTQKSASTVGESFKSIFSRMGKVTNGEGIDDFGEDISQVESTLRGFGIELRETETEFRNFDVVLDDVGARWKAFSSVDQRKIASAFAGVYQSENFLALMNNYDKVAGYVEVAANSAGTAAKKFEAYQDSIEAHASGMRAAFELLSMDTLDSGLVNGILDVGAAALNATEHFGLLKAAIVALGTMGAAQGLQLLTEVLRTTYTRTVSLTEAMRLLSAAGSGGVLADDLTRLQQLAGNLSAAQLQLVISSQALTNEQRAAILTSGGLSAAETQQALATMGLVTAEGSAAAATFSFSGAIEALNFAISANPIGALVTVFSVLVGIIGVVTNTLKHSAEEAEAALQGLNEEIQTLQQSSAPLQELASRYDELSACTNRTEEEQQEFISVQNQLKELLPEVNGYYDEQGNFILAEGQSLESLMQTYQKYLQAKRQELADAYLEKIDRETAAYQRQADEIARLTEYVNLYHKIENGEDLRNYESDYLKSHGYAGELAASSFLSDYGMMYGNVTEAQERLNSLQSEQVSILDDLRAGTANLLSAQNEWYELTTDQQNDIRSALSKTGYTETKALFDALTASGADFSTILSELVEKYEVFRSDLNETADGVPELDGLSAATADLKGQLQSLTDAESDYMKMLDAANGRHRLTDKEVVTLCSKYDGLQDKISLTAEGWELESGAMEIVNNSLSDLQNAYISAQQTMNEVLNSGIKSRLEMVGIELEGIKSLADAYALISNSADDNIYARADKNYNPTGLPALTTADKQSILKWGQAQDALNAALDRLQSLSGFAGHGISSSGSGSSRSASTTDAAKQATDEALAIMEHQIFVWEQKGGFEQAIILQYQKMRDLVHSAAEKYRAQGLAETSEEIRALQKKWWEYADRIADVQDSIYEKRRDTLKNSLALLDGYYSEAEGNSYYSVMQAILEQKAAAYAETMHTAQTEIDRLLAAGTDAASNSIAALQKEYQTAADNLVKTNEKIADNVISVYDDFISKADGFDWWGELGITKLDYLRDKLEAIDTQYQRGCYTVQKYNELVRSAQLDIYNEQKDALQDILDTVEKIVRQESEDKIDALEGQKDKYRDILDLKKQMLRLTDQEASYNRSIEEKTKEIAKVQARIDQLQLDDSREAKSEQAALMEDLAKLQAELAEYQNDHSLKLQEDAIDKEYSNFEDNIDREIHAVQSGLDHAATIHQRVIEYINANWETLYDNLNQYDVAHGSGIVDNIKGAWDTALVSLTEYKNALGGLTVEEAAKTGIDMGKQKPDFGEDAAITQQRNIVQQMYNNSQSAREYFTAHGSDSSLWSKDSYLQSLNQSNYQLRDELEKLTGKAVVFDSKTGKWYMNGRELFAQFGVYHIGGEVGKKAGDFKDNEMFTLLEKGEAVLTAQQQQRVVDLIKSGGILPQGYNDFLRKADTIIRGQELLAKMKNQVQQPNITIQIDNHIEGSGIMNDEKLLRKINDHTCNGLVKAFRKAGIMNGSLPIRPS